MEKGNINRNIAKTKLNYKSSRSHAIIKLTVRTTYLNYKTNELEDSGVGELFLVDLAGSESSDSH